MLLYICNQKGGQNKIKKFFENFFKKLLTNSKLYVIINIQNKERELIKKI